MNKHLAFYHGPAKIVKRLRTRQYAIEHNGKSYKRDVEMIIPVPQLPEKYRDFDPTEKLMALIKPTKHDNKLEIHEGELLIMLDTEKNDWFLAGHSEVPTQNSSKLLHYTSATVGKILSSKSA